MDLALGNNKEFTNSQLLSHIRAIQSTSTLKELAAVFAAPMGCSVAIAQNIPPIGSKERQNSSRYFHYNMPETALVFMRQNYSQKLDPVAKYVLDYGHPVWLSDLLDQPIFSDSGYRKIIQDLIDLVGDGMCVPSFHQSYWGYSFVGFGRPKEEFSEILLWQIQTLSQAIHVRYVLLKKLLQEKVNLTNRESDVIELIAMGKTNTEIALILGIAPHTVATYIKNLYLKLDAADRVTASLRAMSLNLIV